MCYTKVSRQTEILIHDLTVDINLDGFNLNLLPAGSVPPMRIGSELSEEENLGLMADMPEMSIHDI